VLSCRTTDPDFLAVEPNEDSGEKLARFWNCEIVEHSYFHRGVQKDEDEEEDVTLVETVSEEEEREEPMIGKFHAIIWCFYPVISCLIADVTFGFFRWSCDEIGREGPDVDYNAGNSTRIGP